MKIKQLKVAVTSAKNAVKLAHWLVQGPNFYTVHKLLDEVYEYLEEVEDRVAESAIAHGELIDTKAIVKEPEGHISPEEAVSMTRAYLQECLFVLGSMDKYDIGVDNMVGDIYEKLFWWNEYILNKGVV